MTLPERRFLETANAEVAVPAVLDLMTAVRRGEAPILARFEGNYASTTITVMGDRSGFVWAGSTGVLEDRRAGGCQVEADEDSSFRDLRMTRISSGASSGPRWATPSG